MRQRHHYTTEELIELLQEKAAELGAPPTANQVQADEEMPSRASYTGRFGTWSKALAAAGLQPRNQGNSAKRYTKEELIQFLRGYHAMYGKNPSSRQIAKRRGEFPALQTFYERFGTWNNALEAAGLEQNKQCVKKTAEARPWWKRFFSKAD